MLQEPDPDSDAAEVFERVCSKLSLLHSAIEGLTAAREQTPDYSATLCSVLEGLRSLDGRLQAIEHSRALAMSPVVLVEEINAAAQDARVQDRQILAESREALSRSLGQLDGMIARGRLVAGRACRERWIAGGGVLAGILLWSVLPGAIVRSLPESWNAPEWMAARMMGMDQAEAGKRMVETAKPDGR